jgi:hypothetical protein
VIVVVAVMVEITAKAVNFRAEDVDGLLSLTASIFKSHRNNEMIQCFAKYFL